MDTDLSQMNHLQDFLEESIPSVKDLRFQLEHVSPEKVIAKAPLIENSNHMGTAFGGSLYSMLVLTCYSWLYSRLNQEGLECRIVIQTGHIDYLKPVEKTIQTVCHSPDDPDWGRFLSTFEKKERARLDLVATVADDSAVAAKLTGTFVVFKKNT